MESILLFIIIILILIDVFLAYELPTHVAYILITFLVVIKINKTPVYLSLIGVLIWFTLVVFHYTIWRRMIEKIHDKVIAPRRHTGGIEGLIGKEGVIKEIEGVKLISINEELYEFKCSADKEILIGNTYNILDIESNKLLI